MNRNRDDGSVLVRTGLRRIALLGPAFIAAVAYVDPGNVATNVTAGASFGYTLVWVVVLANVMAVLVQYLSAKLGLVTRRSLSSHLGEQLPRGPRIAYWLQAEAIAIATDLAEVVGGAIALYLLFDVPLVLGAAITVSVSVLILMIGDRHGQGALERTIMAFLALIAVGFVAGLFVAPPTPGDLAGGLVPRFDGAESVLLASGIIGATVMPHVIYLHSSLTTDRLGRRGDGLSLGTLLRVTRVDVVAALVLAGLLNLSLLVLAASALYGRDGTDTLTGVHEVVTSELGAGVALLFAVALLGSGLASTSVGSAAGAEVMQGLLGIRLPRLLRRLITAVPAVVVLAVGVEPSRALVVSQVVLSLGIPFALVPLVLLTSRRSVMGEHVNRRAVTSAAWCVAAVVIALNLALLWLTFVG
jgi:manganese transport protein